MSEPLASARSRNVEKPKIACIFYLCLFRARHFLFIECGSDYPLHPRRAYPSTHGTSDIRISSSVGMLHNYTTMRWHLYVRMRWRECKGGSPATRRASKATSIDGSLFRFMFPSRSLFARTADTFARTRSRALFAFVCATHLFSLNWLCWSCVSHTE